MFDALLKFSNKAFVASDQGNAIIGICINFAKAFDIINDQILVKELIYFSILWKKPSVGFIAM